MDHTFDETASQMVKDLSRRLRAVTAGYGEALALRDDRTDAKPVSRAVSQPIVRMERAAAATEVAIDEIGVIFRYADYKARLAVKLADCLAIVADYSGRMTEEKQAEVEQLTQAYLEGIGRMAEEASVSIIRRLLEQ